MVLIFSCLVIVLFMVEMEALSQNEVPDHQSILSDRSWLDANRTCSRQQNKHLYQVLSKEDFDTLLKLFEDLEGNTSSGMFWIGNFLRTASNQEIYSEPPDQFKDFCKYVHVLNSTSLMEHYGDCYENHYYSCQGKITRKNSTWEWTRRYCPSFTNIIYEQDLNRFGAATGDTIWLKSFLHLYPANATFRKDAWKFCAAISIALKKIEVRKCSDQLRSICMPTQSITRTTTTTTMPTTTTTTTSATRELGTSTSELPVQFSSWPTTQGSKYVLNVSTPLSKGFDHNSLQTSNAVLVSAVVSGVVAIIVVSVIVIICFIKRKKDKFKRRQRGGKRGDDVYDLNDSDHLQTIPSADSDRLEGTPEQLNVPAFINTSYESKTSADDDESSYSVLRYNEECVSGEPQIYDHVNTINKQTCAKNGFTVTESNMYDVTDISRRQFVVGARHNDDYHQVSRMTGDNDYDETTFSNRSKCVGRNSAYDFVEMKK